jgi:hypothetical protein
MASFPAADFARMGKVSLVGAFDGIDLYSSSSSASFQYSSTGDSLVIFGKGGQVQDVVQADQGGSITTVCFMPAASSTGEAQGTYYLGGNFTALQASNDTAPTTFANIAAYTSTITTVASSSSLSPLDKGLDGAVRTIHCDSKNRKVWAGGDFLAPVDDQQGGYKGSVAIWDVDGGAGAGEGGAWQPPAFGGLSGPVQTIMPDPTQAEQWLFGGEFVTRLVAGNNTSWMNTTTTSTNGSTQVIGGNGTTVYLNSTTSSIPSSPLGTLGYANSAYLTPIPLLTPISAIDAGPGPTSSSAGHTNTSSLLCASSSGTTTNTNTQAATREQLESGAWWVRDASVGKVTVNLYRVVRASGVRLGNALDGGRRGTTSFRYVILAPSARKLFTTSATRGFAWLLTS